MGSLRGSVLSRLSRLAWAQSEAHTSHRGKVVDQRVAQQDWCGPIHPDVIAPAVPFATPEKHPNVLCGFATRQPSTAVISEVPDELDNVAQFGYPVATGQTGYPKHSASCWSNVRPAIINAAIGRIRPGSGSLPSHCCRGRSGMLLLADRGFNGYRAWQARQTGADLLWRCADNRQLPVVEARWPMVPRRDLPE